MSAQGTCGVLMHLGHFRREPAESRLVQVVERFSVLNMQTRFDSFASHYSLMKKKEAHCRNSLRQIHAERKHTLTYLWLPLEIHVLYN